VTPCQALARPSIKREASDPWDDDPETKRIKTLQSDLTRLKTNIEKAADAKQWSSTAAFNTENVKTQSHDLLEVLDDLRAFELRSKSTSSDEPPTAPNTNIMCRKIRKFFANLFMDRRAFLALRHFIDLFDRLLVLGDDNTPDAKLVLIKRLATVRDMTARTLDMSGIDVATRLAFKRSELWIDYLVQIMQEELQEARGMLNVADRVKHLDNVIDMGVSHSDEYQTAVKLRTMLDESIPINVRLDYVRNTDGAPTLLKDWAPNNILNTAADLLRATPKLNGLKLTKFQDAARLLQDGETIIQNPFVTDAITFSNRITAIAIEYFIIPDDAPLMAIERKTPAPATGGPTPATSGPTPTTGGPTPATGGPAPATGGDASSLTLPDPPPPPSSTSGDVQPTPNTDWATSLIASALNARLGIVNDIADIDPFNHTMIDSADALKAAWKCSKDYLIGKHMPTPPKWMFDWKDANAKTPHESSATPATGGDQTATHPAAATPAEAETAVAKAPQPLSVLADLPCGTTVKTTAVKNKAEWHNHEAIIMKANQTHYTVKMTSGPKAGSTHK